MNGSLLHDSKTVTECNWAGAVFVACALSGALGILSIWEFCYRVRKNREQNREQNG
jgi:hypothetical protein